MGQLLLVYQQSHQHHTWSCQVAPTEMRGGRGRAVFGGGRDPIYPNTMDLVEIATTGNATDFGDLNTIGDHKTVVVHQQLVEYFLVDMIHQEISTDIDYVTISSGWCK